MKKVKKLSLILACGMLMSLPFCSFAAEVVKAERLKPGATASGLIGSSGARIKLGEGAAGDTPLFLLSADSKDSVGDTGREVVIPESFAVLKALQGDSLAKFRETLRLTRVKIAYQLSGTTDNITEDELGYAIPKMMRGRGAVDGVVTVPVDRDYFGFGSKEALDDYIADRPALQDIWEWDSVGGNVRLNFAKATSFLKQ
ncbi:MAG: hypothetical protein K0S08_1999 [Gammaproteobacteria bacterium]|jgi:hypothetical protein|nr:hypothetical protein [Gammaproteobacteria bacterium]